MARRARAILRSATELSEPTHVLLTGARDGDQQVGKGAPLCRRQPFFRSASANTCLPNVRSATAWSRRLFSLFERSQAARFAKPQVREPLLPDVELRRTHGKLPAHVRRGGPALRLTQIIRHLLFAEPRPFHDPTPSPSRDAGPLTYHEGTRCRDASQNSGLSSGASRQGSGNAKAMTKSPAVPIPPRPPATMTTYCRPFSMYERGAACPPAGI